ncbi:unnamed protein product [Diabrotica balteata]|uniref:BolA-like protein 3 n=1 Tax=Diabrotica balteata TaxID=107213 RepID=A0A9N9T013_DIABA|nr:unnamed protein product [Diabrotica balteata]
MQISIFFVLVIVGVSFCEKYSTKYDNIDLDEILKSDRLLNNYIACIMDRGSCTPDGKELKAQEPVNEQKILEKLRGRFPSASSIHVEDTSGGCGAMFNVSIETSDFKGLSIPKQHKIVYDALKEEISKIHGIHLQTIVSD